ncbi:MAG: hypothetical protein BGO89_06760 [Candidatus Kapaibacterium thiocyanatum]|uniref:Uncharacterized protein n=1 Tax=Candidatus Kapaibacterium thiocyanatum TaxID=1895771 RepID=A0A1M3KYV1_9BACT|nr:MAG: hypothetical protein BGO89_06760 ['Candidatus Kapabacteria' thiocyanatum]
MRQDDSPHFSVVVDDNMDRQQWYRFNDEHLSSSTDFLSIVHEFHGLVRYLMDHDLILVSTDILVPDIRIEAYTPHPIHGAPRRFFDACVYLRQQSRILPSGEVIRYELYIALPSLDQYIDDGFRTRHQVEYDSMAQRAIGAERHAKEAHQITIGLAILSLAASIAAVLTSLFASTTITTTSPLDVRVYDKAPVHRSR